MFYFETVTTSKRKSAVIIDVTSIRQCSAVRAKEPKTRRRRNAYYTARIYNTRREAETAAALYRMPRKVAPRETPFSATRNAIIKNRIDARESEQSRPESPESGLKLIFLSSLESLRPLRRRDIAAMLKCPISVFRRYCTGRQNLPPRTVAAMRILAERFNEFKRRGIEPYTSDEPNFRAK